MLIAADLTDVWLGTLGEETGIEVVSFRGWEIGFAVFVSATFVVVCFASELIVFAHSLIEQSNILLVLRLFGHVVSKYSVRATNS